jgi:hypothetical protein
VQKHVIGSDVHELSIFQLYTLESLGVSVSELQSNNSFIISKSSEQKYSYNLLGLSNHIVCLRTLRKKLQKYLELYDK